METQPILAIGLLAIQLLARTNMERTSSPITVIAGGNSSIMDLVSSGTARISGSIEILPEAWPLDY
eukprot:scaffold3241_cov125-Cylindrotheca_fusiformis.AAC.4